MMAKQKIPRVAVAFLAFVVVVFLGLWWWQSQSTDGSVTAKPITQTNEVNPGATTTAREFEKLKGGWRRPDGGYILAIKSVADSGAMDAAYFNPNPINVANAVASQEGGVTKVFIELRDVNYPGSTYTLRYDSARDRLTGVYYQAVERQRYEVVFGRMK